MSLFDCKPDEAIRPERTCVQCVQIDQPVTMAPVTEIGTAVICYQGIPEVTCEQIPAENQCRLNVSQKICVTLPIRFGVDVSAGDAVIGCAGGCDPGPSAG